MNGLFLKLLVEPIISMHFRPIQFETLSPFISYWDRPLDTINDMLCCSLKLPIRRLSAFTEEMWNYGYAIDVVQI
ncbi:hypothetical protein OUZ56_020990 [Daphnia magna]|uniref:Uncharacterized protein n=1 Tax=Daphnia magna TaxID=35525 RepID=A0ABQ9ZG27_9CRUS|nr:hypothetical protein OUZ56_020990 [Daphnia magna]